MPRLIEDYALIGDCHTAALVSRDGSIDWLCFPRFDSPACFAALLGTPNNGRWLLAPKGEIRQSRRHYRDNTLILETDYKTDSGEATVIDLTWHPSFEPAPEPIDTAEALDATDEWWREWASHCTYKGEWSEAVLRSLITLKALTYAPSGGIVASPTTSLPEQIGSVRNWDYRFCWLRDATLTLLSLIHSGFHEESKAWQNWLRRAVAGDPCKTQI